MVWPSPAVVGVAFDDDPFAGTVVGDAYGPAAGKAPTPSGSDGNPGGTAQKNGIVVCAGKSTTGRLKRTVSVLPRATTPLALVVLPFWTSSAPTMPNVY